MKKCMICGWDESDDSRFTCPACGEASWARQRFEAEFLGPEPTTVEVAPAPKRGPGRPRKVQS